MSDATHTPGPWTHGSLIGLSVRLFAEYDRLLVGEVYREDVGGNAMVANARLIAAAPDLLAACAGMAERLDEYARELDAVGLTREASNVSRMALTLHAAAAKARTPEPRA